MWASHIQIYAPLSLSMAALSWRLGSGSQFWPKASDSYKFHEFFVGEQGAGRCSHGNKYRMHFQSAFDALSMYSWVSVSGFFVPQILIWLSLNPTLYPWPVDSTWTTNKMKLFLIKRMAIANGTCVSFCNQPKAHFGLPAWVHSWAYNLGKCYIIMERGFNAGQTHSNIYPSILIVYEL